MRLRSLQRVWRAVALAVCLLAGAPGTTEAAHAASGHALRVQSATLTVDGLTVESGLNLHIPNWHYLYVYLPGSGTAVIAERPFAGAQEQKGAFRGNALTVSMGGSQVQLTAANRMRGSRSAYVRFDRGVGPGTRVPAVSFGDAALVPAVWPGRAPDARRPLQRRVKMRGARSLRSARLCRPSPHGRELCATVREVTYKGW